MRPKNFYVLLALGERPHIIEGQALAYKMHAQQRPFRTREAAEEWAAWWQYEHQPAWHLPAPRLERN